ncbi:MAG: ROK family protein [Ignavibacteriales bacterium]|nr:MAG: ROK family protein [Ignavibacteriales bacterium]
MKFGMDYGGTNIKAGVFDNNGETVNFVEEKLSALSSQGNLLENLIAHSKKVIGKNKIESGGFAIKGLINTETGKVENDIGAGQMLAGINLKKAFSEALGFPFYVDNDARAYAWGEYKFGAGVGSKAMVCMTLGTGLGCSLVVDDKPYCGSDSSGGLLGGHISIDRNGPDCTCGQKGCLELYCSATALTEKVKLAHPVLNDSAEALPAFFEKVKLGDKEFTRTFNEFIDNLSVGIVNVIHAYGPDVVVLGGGVLNSADIILPPLTELVHKRAWTFPKGKVQIRKSLLGNNAAAIGIAFLEN